MGYSSQEHEQGLAAFIRPQRRDRFADALAKGGKARQKELARLHDYPYLDPRWMRPLPTSGQGTQASEAILAAIDRAAPGAVGYLVSGDPELDGQFLAVENAIEASAWTDEGTLISLLPGRVAVYVGELVDSARLLKR